MRFRVSAMSSEYDRLLKVLIVGDAGVGKSAFLMRFVDNVYSDYYVSTIGIDFKVRSLFLDGKTIKLQLWDTAGQERFQSVTRSFFRGADAVIIAYDVGRRESFNNMKKWLEHVEEGTRAGIAKMLIGNKNDLSDDLREVSITEGETFAQALNLIFFETSAKDAMNVEDACIALVEEALKQAITTGPSTISYGPPPRQHAGACCHRLGPPGNLFHVGSTADRESIVQASRFVTRVHEWPTESGSESDRSAAEALSGCLSRGLPLVMRDFAKLLSVEALAALDVEALERRFATRVVEVSVLTEAGRSVPPFRKQDMALGDFFEESVKRSLADAARRALYLQQLPIAAFLPELASDDVPLHGPAVLRTAVGADMLVTSTLFCGAEGVRTSLHFDRGDYALANEHADAESSIDNLFLQLSGRKRFELFRPCDHANLYPRGTKDPGAPHVSLIEDTERVSPATFPLFREAGERKLTVELAAGDALLLPRWWWHQSLALSDGSAINWWFETFDANH